MGVKQSLVGVLLLLTGMTGFAVENGGELPQIGARIADHAAIITNSQKHMMHQLLSQHEHSNRNHVMIMTVESTGSDSPEAYAKRLWEGYAGEKKGTSALLLLVKAQPAAAIIAGDALSGKLNAVVIKKITGEDLAPPLKAGDFDTAAMEGIKAIVGTLTE